MAASNSWRKAMKRIILVVLLVSIAALAGIVRSYSKTGRSISDIPNVVAGESDSQGSLRDEIRKTYELAPARESGGRHQRITSG